MSNTIKGAVVFRSGTWNGQEFTDADLQSIARSFAAANLAGRVPLKFGHSDEQPLTDGQPALGWVSNVQAIGGDLYADFTDIPSQVYAFIKKGLYKFTSIELLKNATVDGRTYPYLLDAVALLGAEPPAVTGLSDLQKLAPSRREGLATEFASRSAFRWTAPTERTRVGGTEAERLRAENEALRAQLAKAQAADRTQKVTMARRAATELIEGAVRGGKITPAQRTAFSKLFHIDDDEAVLALDLASVASIVGMGSSEAAKFMRTPMRSAFSRNPKASGDSMDANIGESFEEFNDRLVKMTRQYAAEHGVSTFDAAPIVMKMHPELQQPFLSFMFED